MTRIYHYTSINCLSYILKDRKIKFSALSKVNDLNEGVAADLGDLRKYFFVSCWTANKEESIPLWNLYTPNMKGVRISLELPLFNTYNSFENANSYFSEKECLQENYMIVPNRQPFINIKYDDDITKLYPSISIVDKNEAKISPELIGRYKAKHWEFESEVRFIFQIVPGNNFDEVGYNKLKEKTDLGFSDYYLPIKPEAFGSMEILLGPKCEESDLIIVDALKSKYNPKVKISESSILIKKM